MAGRPSASIAHIAGSLSSRTRCEAACRAAMLPSVNRVRSVMEISLPPGQVAQHDSRDTSRPNAWAASSSPSDMVRYGAQAPARSVTVIWARIA